MHSTWYRSPVFLWTMAIVITVVSVLYQRLTGPTNPKRCSVVIEDVKYKFKISRNPETTNDEIIALNVPDNSIGAIIKWKRFKSADDWQIDTLTREDENLIAVLPKQPRAGKIIFELSLIDKAGNSYPLTDEPIISRFKDPVPLSVLLIHVIIMFSWMLISIRTGIEALAGGPKMFDYSMITLILLIVGGLILGPVVQKYAFNAYWTGWPFGHDLTDNKTLVAFIFWVVAIWRCRKPGGSKWVVIASIITLTVYLIPHSAFGSEFDYTKIK